MMCWLEADWCRRCGVSVRRLCSRLAATVCDGQLKKRHNRLSSLTKAGAFLDESSARVLHGEPGNGCYRSCGQIVSVSGRRADEAGRLSRKREIINSAKVVTGRIKMPILSFTGMPMNPVVIGRYSINAARGLTVAQSPARIFRKNSRCVAVSRWKPAEAVVKIISTASSRKRESFADPQKRHAAAINPIVNVANTFQCDKAIDNHRLLLLSLKYLKTNQQKGQTKLSIEQSAC